MIATGEDANIKLQPDMNIVMPNKKSLKHRTLHPYLLWTSIATAAAIFAFILIVTKDKYTIGETKPETNKIVETKPETNKIVETKPETNTIVEMKPETNTIVETKPAIIPEKPSAKKTSTMTTIRKHAPKPVEPVTIEQETPVESSGNQDDVPQRENIRIERIEPITIAFAPVEMMNKEKTVFVYQPYYNQHVAFKAIDNIAFALEKFSDDLSGAKQNISQVLDGFRLPKIFSHLSLDSGIDREIDEWTKNNPGVPFDVFIDNNENKMKEIYDENGNLVKVVFFTNKSLKYKNNKTYKALYN
jgi:hypothetical protein